MRFSNKIPKYSLVSVPFLIGLSNPAEQLFLGGIFFLSFCYTGKVAGQLYCLSVSALFALRFFCLVFNDRRLWSIGIRCFFRLRIQSPALSPTRSPVLSPALPRAWSPTSASGRHRLVHLVRICRRKPLGLHSTALSANTSGAKLSPPAIYSPILGGDISTLETSSASSQHCGASTTSAGHRSTLHYYVPASKTLAAWAQASTHEALTDSAGSSTLPILAERAIWSSWSLDALAESARAWPLTALDILIRALTERTIWAWSPVIIRLDGFGVCTHSWSAGHSASQSLPASAAAAATSRPGKCFAGQNCQCQHKNDRCCNCCLFHFRFLSQKFHFTAFLSPEMGSFYRDSGAGRKKVTPELRFAIKL